VKKKKAAARKKTVSDKPAGVKTKKKPKKVKKQTTRKKPTVTKKPKVAKRKKAPAASTEKIVKTDKTSLVNNTGRSKIIGELIAEFKRIIKQALNDDDFVKVEKYSGFIRELAKHQGRKESSATRAGVSGKSQNSL